MSVYEKYGDIINLEHHVSERHPQMSVSDRAAQFAAFAALSGYGEAVNETARLTDSEHELGEYEIDVLNRKISILTEYESEKPYITVLYFIPDEKKSGGAYCTVSGNMRKIDTYLRSIVFENGNSVSLDRIIDIQSPVFEDIIDF